MNRYLFIMIIIFLSVVGTACGNSSDSVQGEGYILEKSDNRVLVLDQKFENKTWADIYLDYEGQAIWIAISDASKYEPGQKVQYWLKSGIEQSYPSRASAKKMKIVKE